MTLRFTLPDGKTVAVDQMNQEIATWLQSVKAQPTSDPAPGGPLPPPNLAEQGMRQQVAGPMGLPPALAAGDQEILEASKSTLGPEATATMQTDMRGAQPSPVMPPTPVQPTPLPAEPPLPLPPRQPQSTSMDMLKSGVSGIAEGVVRAPLIGGDIANLGMRGINSVFPGTISDETVNRTGSQPWIDAFKGSPQDNALKDVGADLTYEPETMAGRYTKSAASAVGGGASFAGIGVAGLKALPGIGKSVGSNAATVGLTKGSVAINATSGLGAELGLDISRDFDPKKEGNPLYSLVGGVGTSLAGNTIRQIKAPNLDQQVYNSTTGMKAADWKAVKQEVEDFKAAGSTSYTLADTPTLQPRIGGLAQGLSNTAGGNALGQKLGLDARRNQDIPNVLSSMRDDIGQLGDPRELSAVLSRMGEGRVRDAVKVRSDQMKGTLDAAPPVDPQALISAAGPLRLAGAQGGNSGTGMQMALNKAHDALLGPKSHQAAIPGHLKPPNLNVRGLSQNVKGLRKVPTISTDSPSSAISRAQQMQAADLADDALRTASPDFSKAMKQYGDYNDSILGPMERSLTGGIRGVTDETSLLSQVRKVPGDKIGQETTALGMDEGQRRQLARILSEKVDPIPDLTRAGDMAKTDRELLKNLLESTTPDTAGKVANKLKAVDQLSKTTAQSSTDRTMGMNLSKNALGAMTNPMGTASMRSGLRTSEKETAKLAELITNPTAENIRILQRLSKVDPRAKRALQWISSLAASSQTPATMNSEGGE